MPHARNSNWLPALMLMVAAERSQVTRLLRVLALCGLFLLPMQMRAGIEQPHPHALLHLILDARDHSFDHHAELNHEASHESSPGSHAGGHESAPPDLPAFGDTIVVSGGLAITAVLLIALALSASRARPGWPRLGGWLDHLTALEPPPPRPGFIQGTS